MKSTFFGITVCFVASTVLWAGCSSSTTTQDTTPDGGNTTEGGTNDGGGGSDAAADAPGADSAAPPITGPFIGIKYGAANCPAFTPCGGDVKGQWNLKDGCATEAVFDGAKAQCAGLTESNVVFEARGYVLADGVTITRKTEVKFSATFAVPQTCKAGVGGSCATIATALKSLGGLDTATCVDDAGSGGCTCDVGDTTLESTAEAYTTAGNTLTTTGATPRTYDYCVAGAQITYKETTQGADAAIFVLEK